MLNVPMYEPARLLFLTTTKLQSDVALEFLFF
jgi:hypothetical protein